MSNQKLADALRAFVSLAEERKSWLEVLSPEMEERLSQGREALAEHDASEHHEGLMIIGNPVDGFRFVGPFACESDGVEWAMEHAPNETWTTATMQEPQGMITYSLADIRNETGLPKDAPATETGQPSGYTMFLREADGTGTTHISYHPGDRSEAERRARAECANDWGYDQHEAAELHVLGVAAGNVTIIEWDDLT